MEPKRTKFEVESEFGEKIRGIKSTPKEGKKLPVVLLVHGFSSSADSSTICFLDEKLNKNYITYRFSFSGRGESEGKYAEMTLSKEVSELKSVFNYVQNQEDTGKIAIFAHSFGTNATIIANPKVSCIILGAPFDKPLEFYEKRYVNDLHKDGNSCWPKTSTGENICLGSQFWPDLEKYDLDILAKEISAPTLIVHGTEDTTIYPEQSESLFRNLKVEKERILIPNADHKFSPNHEGLYIEAKKWLERFL